MPEPDSKSTRKAEAATVAARLQAVLESSFYASQRAQYEDALGRSSTPPALRVDVSREEMRTLADAARGCGPESIAGRCYSRLLYRLLDLSVCGAADVAALQAHLARLSRQGFLALQASRTGSGDGAGSKEQLAAQLAPLRKDLICRLNNGARQLGQRDYLSMELRQHDLTPAEVIRTATDFEQRSRDPAAHLVAELRERYGADIEYDDLGRIYAGEYSRLSRPISLEAGEAIARRLAARIGLDLSGVRFEFVPALPGLNRIGQCYYLQLPDDVRIVMSGALNYQLLRNCLHEIGQVLYAVNAGPIDFVLRTNLGAFDKAMAFVFEGLLDLPLTTPEIEDLGITRPEIAAALRLRVLYRLRYLAAQAYFTVLAYQDPECDLGALYRDTYETFGLIRCSSKDDWALLEITQHPAYIPYALQGAGIGFQLIQFFRRTGIAPGGIGSLLRQHAFAQGAARSWRSKLLELTGEQFTVSAIGDVLCGGASC